MIIICYKFVGTPTSCGHVEFLTWKFLNTLLSSSHYDHLGACKRIAYWHWYICLSFLHEYSTAHPTHSDSSSLVSFMGLTWISTLAVAMDTIDAAACSLPLVL